ncbi:MAG TPA: D-alanine--D-alanine ligase family protein, partial [Candidatus Acidoferrales bacterium]|nr:D-alanine--D-alanine ligase family protein [Candidatus Acidoferrales bacterium]
SIFDAIDRIRYEVTLIGIDRDGRWHLLEETQFRLLTDQAQAALKNGGREVALLPAPNMGQLLDRHDPQVATQRVDVVFPILHGTYGEDGTIQGFLDLADIPYVGAGVMGSAVGMDKDVQKRLLQAAGIAVAPFVTVRHREWAQQPLALTERVRSLGLPLFVKPANLGSSVGITKVKSSDGLMAAVEQAFAYDTKIVIEKGIDAREIECAVLGNDEPIASVPGEVCPSEDFYSYEAKYIDENGARLLIPAPLDADLTRQIQSLSVRVFQILECSGMARVDCFIERGSGKIYLNEINTLPGFTSISMYPKLWEASGIAYSDLIGRLIELAIERQTQRRQLKRSYLPTTQRN